MTLTFITHDPCGVCGFLRKGVMVATMRVNKRSMRSTSGKALRFFPEHCMECGQVSATSVQERWRLTPDSAEKVRAYRSRRWPELEAA